MNLAFIAPGCASQAAYMLLYLTGEGFWDFMQSKTNTCRHYEGLKRVLPTSFFELKNTLNLYFYLLSKVAR